MTNITACRERSLDMEGFMEALMCLAWRKYPEETQIQAYDRLVHESIYALPCAPKAAQVLAAQFASTRLAISAATHCLTSNCFLLESTPEVELAESVNHSSNSASKYLVAILLHQTRRNKIRVYEQVRSTKLL